LIEFGGKFSDILWCPRTIEEAKVLTLKISQPVGLKPVG
jgi:hypothetical protein